MTSAAQNFQPVLLAATIFLEFLGEFCSNKFDHGEGLPYLEKSIAIQRGILKLLPPVHLRVVPMVNLGAHLSSRYGLLKVMADLEEIITVQQGIIALSQPGHPLRYAATNTLASCLYNRYLRTGIANDLEEAVAMHRDILEHHPPDNPLYSMSLSNLADCFYTRYGKLGMVGDLEEAFTLQRRVLELRPVGHPGRSASLDKLAGYLYYKYKQVGGIEHLEESIVMHRDALLLRSVGHADWSDSLYNLAAGLSTRYREVGATNDSDEAISIHRTALDLRLQGHHARSASPDDLANLQTRFRRLGMMDDLEEAIALHRSALELGRPGDPFRFASLHNFAVWLGIRYDQLGRMDDLEEATKVVRESLQLLPDGHPDRSVVLDTFSRHLLDRYQRLGTRGDLQEAMSTHAEILRLSHRPGHPPLPSTMDNSGVFLSNLYRLSGDPRQLENAIMAHRAALTLHPSGHPDRAISFNGLAFCLITRYNRHGVLTDLEEGTAMYRSALELRPPGHPLRPQSLDNLGCCLLKRFDELVNTSDLADALVMHREALKLRPLGDPDLSMSMCNVAICLFRLYYLQRNMRDLELAILMGRNVVQLRPQGHHERCLSLYNLASMLLTRFRYLGEMSDLLDALVKCQDALQAQPQNEADRPRVLDNLSFCYFLRYDRLKEKDDLSQAIAIRRQALECYPPNHPLRGNSLRTLTDWLLIQFDQFGSLNSQQEAFDLFSQLSHVSHTVSLADLRAAKGWVNAAEAYGHRSTVLAYQTLLRLMVRHLATLPSLPQNIPILKVIASSLAADGFSACVRHQQQITDAVELVEQGRSVFWTQYSRLRSPLDDVIASAGDTGKALAEKFTKLSSLLRSTLNSPSQNSLPTSQHDQAWHLGLQLQDVIDNIRKLPGHSRFLLPLLYSDIRNAAVEGPVIIVNASQYGCDAIIVLFEGDPIHIPLETTKTRVRDLSQHLHDLTILARSENVSRGIYKILQELWDDVVSPVVSVLETSCPPQSRIWWCPTAEFSLLPLHAAGAYRRGQPNLADMYISSYTPTLTALIHARQQSPPESTSDRPRFVVVGQANTPGEQALASVNVELARIAERITPLATLTTIEGENASVAKVKESLSEIEYVHLACHGVPDQKRPFESAFALHDGRLKIEDIMRCNLQRAQFAYLSACHTMVGDEGSPDEVIYLAAAMHFAGFRSVVGTMWAVDDGVASKITSAFYTHLVDEGGRLDYKRAAYALNRATWESGGIPLDQRILFVHIGV